MEQITPNLQEAERQVALAEAQILGFIHGRGGYSLASLINGMGLTHHEWEQMKASYPILGYLTEHDIGEIEQTVKAA